MVQSVLDPGGCSAYNPPAFARSSIQSSRSFSAGHFCRPQRGAAGVAGVVLYWRAPRSSGPSVTALRLYCENLNCLRSPAEAVADAGLDAAEAGPGRIELVLVAQVGDVDPQGVRVAGVLRAPDAGRQLPVHKDAVCVQRQLAQEVELDWGQVDLPPGERDATAGDVNRQLAADKKARPRLLCSSEGTHGHHGQQLGTDRRRRARHAAATHLQYRSLASGRRERLCRVGRGISPWTHQPWRNFSRTPWFVRLWRRRG